MKENFILICSRVKLKEIQSREQQDYYRRSEMQQHVRPKVILIGDSITQMSYSVKDHGWGAALADWYGRSADVINRGYSGYNSRWMKAVLPRLLPERDPNIILATIFLGANDSSSGGQNVPIDEYQQNLAQLTRHCQWVNDKMEIILITPPIVDHNQWSDRHPTVVVQYARKVIELVQESRKNGFKNVHVVNLWQEGDLLLPAEISVLNWYHQPKPTRLRSIQLGDDLNDGLHLGIGGNEKVFQHVSQCILKNCPAYAIPASAINPPSPQAGHLSLHFPHWSELQGKSATDIESLISNWQWN